MPSQPVLGIDCCSICDVWSGATATHHIDRPVTFCSIIRQLRNAYVSHVLATVLLPDFGQHEPPKFLHRNKLLSVLFRPWGSLLVYHEREIGRLLIQSKKIERLGIHRDNSKFRGALLLAPRPERLAEKG
jgi:hypothetical protein